MRSRRAPGNDGSAAVSRPAPVEQLAVRAVERPMGMRTKAAATLLLAVGACATPPAPVARTALPRAATRLAAPVRDGVIGLGAAQLQALLGTPVAQLAEGSARKLQFAGSTCVLDAYLYPPERGGEPAVTHVDTRRLTGEDADRMSCIAALRTAKGS